jgi:hypothetical protein
MEFGGGPTKYAMRCPTAAREGGHEREGVPPSATTGPVNIHKCSEVPVSPEGSYLLWEQLNVTGSSSFQFQLAHSPHGGALCLTAVHDSGPTFNDELAATPCNSSSNFQRWKWTAGSQLMIAMTQTEKDSVWAGRPGRCNGPVQCCLDVRELLPHCSLGPFNYLYQFAWLPQDGCLIILWLLVLSGLTWCRR